MERVIQLSRAHWVIVVGFIGVAFPLVLVLAFMPTIADWYATTTLAPSLERDLGFRAAVGHHSALASSDTFFITEVKSGGVFDRAGIKPGDVPEIHHGPGDFYGVLESHRGHAVELRFVRISAGPTDTFPVEHRFTVVVPRPLPNLR